MTAQDTYFELSFAPSMELVSVVRRFVGAFYERLLTDGELAHRVALAAHELLENAVKYSLDGETSIRLDVKRGATPSFVIRTRNRTSADNALTLQARLDELNTSGNADAHYMALLHRSALPENVNQRGGLGIGRVASEAEMDLSVEIHEGGLVEMIACSRAPQEAV